MLDLKWAKSQLIEYRVKKINPNTILFFLCRSQYLTYKEHSEDFQKEEF